MKDQKMIDEEKLFFEVMEIKRILEILICNYY
jgi:hypothetical protein